VASGGERCCGAGSVEEEDATFVPTGTPHLHNNQKAKIHQMILFQAMIAE
jgi:hypothetical protein